jgi:hypothetical protein
MRSLLGLALTVLVGCSSFMTKPPVNPRPGEWIICSDSSSPPTIDTAVAGIGIFGGIGAWVIIDNNKRDDGVTMTDNGFDATELFVKTAAVLGVVTGIIYGFSAIYGYNTAGRCKKLKTAHPRGFQVAPDAPAPPAPPAPMPAP